MKTVNYVILTGLALRPMSGYDLTGWMSRVTSHFFAVGHSSIYPALAGLEDRGLVVHETVPSGRGPERKVYSLTDAGREELLSWVDSPAAEVQVRDEQLVKALCYGLLPRERAIARLREIRGRHEEKLAYYRDLASRLERRWREYGMSESAYLGTMLTLRRGIGAEKSYVEWCDEAEAMISGHASE